MKFTKAFNEFLAGQVNLDQARLDRLVSEVAAIEDFLGDHAVFGDLVLDVIPAGSWAHRTIIRPVQDNDVFDADVLLYVTEVANWDAKDYVQKLYEAFRGSDTYRPLARRKTRCVRIDYPDDFHIDVVPYLERGGSHYIANRSEPEDTGSFELSNPVAFTEWMDERHRWTGGDFVKVVRLLKYLRDFKDNFVCKSIILTTLLGNEVNEIEASMTPEIYKDVPTSLVTIINKLAVSLPESMPAVLDPGGTGDNFTDRYHDEWNYENFRKWITYYADKAERALKEEDRDKSLTLWREILGEEFHSEGIEKAAATTPAASFRASAAWSGEQSIDQPPFNKSVHLNPQVRVKVVGRCTGLHAGKLRRKRGFRQFDLPSRGNQVPKNRQIRFTATVTGLSRPYTLYWKVRNGGAEAAARHQLRGEICKDDGSGARVETTSYKGSHYVECYVVADGVVVARDRQLVVVT